MGKKTAETETTEPVKPDVPPVKVDVVLLEDKILHQARGMVSDLLTLDWSQVYQAYRKAYIESGEEDFSFGVGLNIKLQPKNDGVKVTCKLSYSNKFTDETAPVIVSNQPDMFRA
jgi:hypothetical protein